MELLLETWEWVLIALGICLFIITNAVVLWLIKRRKNKKRLIQKQQKQKDEEKNVPSPTSTTIEEDNIDETVITTKDKGDAYGQHFAVVTPAQTALSPPRRERKESNNSVLTQSVMIEEYRQEEVEQEHQQNHQSHIRSVFSLSPLHESSSSSQQTTPAATAEESHINNSSSSDLSRAFTPFQGHTPTLKNQIWRGPTPPWTQHQYPPRQTSTSSSAS